MQTNIGITSTNIRDLIQEINDDGYKRERFRVCINELDENSKGNSSIYRDNADEKYIWGSKVTVNFKHDLKQIFSGNLLSNVREFFDSRDKYKIEDIEEVDLIDLMFDFNIGYKKFSTTLNILFNDSDVEIYEEYNDNDSIEKEDTDNLELLINTPIEEDDIDIISISKDFVKPNEVPDFSFVEDKARETLSDIVNANNLSKETILYYHNYNEYLMDEIKKKDNEYKKVKDKIRVINENYKNYQILSEQKTKDSEEQLYLLKLDIDEKILEIEKLNTNSTKLKNEYRDIETSLYKERALCIDDKNELLKTIEDNKTRIKNLEDDEKVRKQEILDKDQNLIIKEKNYSEMTKLYEEEIESLNTTIEDYKLTIKGFGTLRKLIEKIANKI